jgi:hypothetical protein
MQNMSFQLGEATAKLQLLDAPRPTAEARHVETEPVEQGSDAVEVPSAPTAAPTPQAAMEAAQPTPAPQAAPEKSGFLGRLFGR